MRKSTARFPDVRATGSASAATPTQTDQALAGLAAIAPQAALESRVSTSRLIADALRAAIVDGTLQPGTPLRQDAVARRFAVSAIPVREALRQLESEGWVRSETHKGATVSPLLADEAREIYEIRAALESLAIGFAIDHHTQHTLERAESCLRAARAESDAARYARHNEAFHLSLYQPADKPHLLEMIDALHRRGERYLRLKLDRPLHKAKSDQEHDALLAAVREGDRVLAQALVTEHLLSTGNLLHHFVTELQAAQAAAAPRRRVRRSAAIVAAPVEDIRPTPADPLGVAAATTP